jgi:hypothetical protein
MNDWAGFYCNNAKKKIWFFGYYQSESAPENQIFVCLMSEHRQSYEEKEATAG